MNRLEREDLLMAMAELLSRRSTCRRLGEGCGAVVTLGGMIVGAGYNGAVSGKPHCIDEGCTIVGGRCIMGVHAESNALRQAMPNVASLVNQGASREVLPLKIYCTHEPCPDCFSLIVHYGVTEVIFKKMYYLGDKANLFEYISARADAFGIKYRQYKPSVHVSYSISKLVGDNLRVGGGNLV